MAKKMEVEEALDLLTRFVEETIHSVPMSHATQRYAGENIVSIADIAKRLNVGATTPTNWPRRYKDFPAAIAVVSDKTALYDWAEVSMWAARHGKGKK